MVGLRAFAISTLAVLGVSSIQAIAQNSTPLPSPTGSWCYSDRSTFDNICNFESAQDVCDAAMEDYYPGRSFLLVKVSEDERSAVCTVDRDMASATGAHIGSPIGTQRCESGFLSGGMCAPIPQQQSNVCGTGGNKADSGNPIDILTGIKHQKFMDFATSDGRFKITRSYASRSYGTYNNNSYGTLGRAWSIDQLPRMQLGDFGSKVRIFIPGHQALDLRCSPSGCVTEVNNITGGGAGSFQFDTTDASFDRDLTVAQNTIPVVDRGGRKFIFKSVEFDGELYFVVRRVEMPGGYAIDYASSFVDESMSGTTTTYDLTPKRFIVTGMTDSFGRSAIFDYYTHNWEKSDGAAGVETRQIPIDGTYYDHIPTKGPLKRITLPDLSTLEFTYNAVSNRGLEWGLKERLFKVTRYAPNGGDVTNRVVLDEETYHYEKTGQSFSLTGLTDTAGVRYASWSYSDDGQAVSSEHAGSVERFQLSYDVDTSSFPKATVTETNPLGRQTIYRSSLTGRYIEDIEGQASPSCVGDAIAISEGGGVLEFTDREGRTTRKAHNVKGWVTDKREALGSTDEVRTTTNWHDVYKLPTRIERPGLLDERAYDGAGRLTSRTLIDTSVQANAPRGWTYGYDVGPNIISIDGTLPGSSDTQSFTYLNERLTSMTNEVGHVTQYTDHNPIGSPGKITDPNGIETVLEYDAEHKLRKIIEAVGIEDATTIIVYNSVDEITSITQPNGSKLTFEYDAARRLVAIENSAGERIEFSRNAASGITGTVIKGTNGGVAYFANQVRDERNRILNILTEGGATSESNTQIAYDRESNPTSITDPRGNLWQNQFDNLNRLIKETDPLNAETQHSLTDQNDSRNALSTVTDARNIATNYVRNGYGEVIQEISAERGGTTYVRDQRGLVTSMTEARGVVVNYTYDAAGRVLSETYQASGNGSNDDVRYEYDLGPYGVGQLTAIIEGFGRTDYTYTPLGFMGSETRKIGSQTYTTLYSYDKAGEVLQTTYPTGTVIALTRDNVARVTAITATDPDGVSTNILSNAAYNPFGPLKGANMGDGHALNLTYDQAYRAKSLTRIGNNGALMDITFSHDDVGDITAMTDNVRPDRSQTFTYDPVSRLTQAQGGYGRIDYSYNLVGDRTQKTSTPSDTQSTPIIEEYAYTSTSALLTDISIGGTVNRSFGYSASGQILQDRRNIGGLEEDLFEFDLNARGRMISVRRNGSSIAAYGYDVFEQRIQTSKADGKTIHYHYDDEGRLISETDAATGALIRDYIWLGLMPVATLGMEEGSIDERCKLTLLSDLRSRRTNRETRLTELDERIVTVTGNLSRRETRHADVQSRRDALQTTLAGVPASNVIRIDTLTAKIAALDTTLAELDAIIAGLTERVTELEARQATLQEAIATISARITRLEARCDSVGIDPVTGEGPDGQSAMETGLVLSYLHADHLGRPAFATDSSGEIIWDGGITTPFGVQIETMGAMTQNLMFPGQYRDEETGFYQNWHRTYDPTLGRYLQSDPIGLAGGLNRYAYVGGNPVSWVDFNGLFKITTEFWVEYGSYLKRQVKKPNVKNPYGLAFLAGRAIGGLYATLKYDVEYDIPETETQTCEADDLDDDASIGEVLDYLLRDKQSPDRCKIVKDQCLKECGGFLGGARSDQAMPFNRCVNQCMYDNDCGGINYR